MYKLSKARRELLKRNRGRIGLLLHGPDGVQAMSNNCLYEYLDGSICVASAALSELERSFINLKPDTYQARVLGLDGICDIDKDKNTCSIGILFDCNAISLNTEDLECLKMLQKLHDTAVRMNEAQHTREFIYELNRVCEG